MTLDPSNQDQSGSTDAYFAVAQNVYPSARRLRWALQLLFKGVPLSGRSVLDVGGGSGAISFYAAAKGASRVLCLEPSAAGSNPSMDEAFQRFERGLDDPTAVELERKTFQEFAPEGQQFDVIVINAAINHLDEEACARLPHDPIARASYLELFRKLYKLMVPGGQMVLADAAQRNLWGAVGMRSPFAPTIDWRIHAQPRVWAELAQQAGFVDSKIQWQTTHRLGPLGHRLLGNAFGSWLTNSHFVVSTRRASSAGA